jgi:uncharacterized membrane protein YqjE
MHALLNLVVREPQLFADHAQAYAELAAADMQALFTACKRQAQLRAVALCCFGVAVVLAGVALMLWAITPVLPEQALWVLYGVPLAPLLLAAWCLRASLQAPAEEPFKRLREELRADRALFCEWNKS